MAATGGFFGGGGSETESTTNITDFTSVDNKIVEGDNPNVGGNNTFLLNVKGKGQKSTNLNFQTTDYGALDSAKDVVSKALDAIAELSKGNADVSKASVGVAGKAAESDTTESIKTLVIGLAVVGVAWALKGAFK